MAEYLKKRLGVQLMNVTIGTIDLGENVLLRGLDADTIAANVERSDAGVAQVLLGDMDGGRSLELYLLTTIATEQEILALAALKASVPLTHPRFSGQVYVLGTEMEDWVEELADPTPDHDRIGKIKLIEA